jgi:hypothetical protein
MEADLLGLSGLPLFELLADAGDDVKAALKGESNLGKFYNFIFNTLAWAFAEQFSWVGKLCFRTNQMSYSNL